MVGALQKRMIRAEESFDLTKEDDNRSIYTITNHNSEDKVYACVERMGLYNFNTPIWSFWDYVIKINSTEKNFMSSHLSSRRTPIRTKLPQKFLCKLLVVQKNNYHNIPC